MSKRFWNVGGVVVGLSCLLFSVESGGTQTESLSSLGEEPHVPQAVLLAPGQIQTVAVDEVERVAVGDPDVADVTIVSPSQLLVQAKKPGSTNLILWDANGEHRTTISVVDPRPEAISGELPQLLDQLHLQSVEVKLRGGNVFLIGEVAREEDLAALEQITAKFEGVVVNLVAVNPPATVPAPPGPLVKLSVQVVELSKSDVEKLGVKWSESMSLTEPEATDRTVDNALFRWGTSITRSSVAATINALVQKNKARILSEPKLVTASGKEASSFVGVEVPIIEATSFGTATTSVSASINFRKTGVVLKMTPTVHPATSKNHVAVSGGSDAAHVSGQTQAGVESEETKITTIIESEVSSIDSSVGLSVPVGSQTILVPGFKVRRATTEVTTASGETVIIAGLLEVEDSDSRSQVPALGSIPVLGRLFKSPEVKSTRRELVITVTPELMAEEIPVRQAQGAAIAQQPLGSPQETTTALQPSSLEQAPPATGEPLAPTAQYSEAQAQPQGQIPEAALTAALEQARGQERDAGAVWPEESPGMMEPEGHDTAELSLPEMAPPQERSSQSRGQTHAITEVTVSSDNPRLQYALQIHDQIAQAIHYPAAAAEAQRQQGAVKLRLHLFADGTLERAVITESSGDDVLDSEVLNTAQRQAPYPPFPPQLTEEELWLDIPVVFHE